MDIQVAVAPDCALMCAGLLIPRLPRSALQLAVAIVGAGIMPANFYLHSALVHSRRAPRPASAVAVCGGHCGIEEPAMLLQANSAILALLGLRLIDACMAAAERLAWERSWCE